MALQTQLVRPVYIDAAFRSPIGKFGGSLAHLSAPELAGELLKKAVEKSGHSKADYVFLGHARQAGAGPNPARQATILGGLAENTPAWTLNQACASGLTAIVTGVDKIQLGQAGSVWAGGVEAMSQTPYLLMKSRWGQRLGHDVVLDGMYKDGFHCPMAKMLMGETVEKFLATELKISRTEQDEFALKSQEKAIATKSSGGFNDEIIPIEARGKKPGLNEDEHIREGLSLEKLAKLPSVFDPESGTLTAGNSSGITDGASFLHLNSEKNKNSLVEILDYKITALDPRRMGLGPVSACQQLLKNNGLTASDIDFIELNEAFAAQAIACQRELKFDGKKVNVKGGSIALGHPIGATGARITTTLIHSMRQQTGALGIATLCVSGGMGFSLLLRSI